MQDADTPAAPIEDRSNSELSGWMACQISQGFLVPIYLKTLKLLNSPEDQQLTGPIITQIQTIIAGVHAEHFPTSASGTMAGHIQG